MASDIQTSAEMTMSPNFAKYRTLLPCAASALFLAASCAVPGQNMDESGTMRICLRDFNNGVHFELVNESYASSHKAPPGAEMRVQTGEVMSAWIEALADKGLWDYARPGGGPLEPQMEAGFALTSVIEVESGSNHGWITFRKGLTQEELTFYSENKYGFITIFNQTPGYQQVVNPDGADIFRSN